MTDHRQAAIQYARSNYDKFLNTLKQFVSIPSVSTDADHDADIRQASEWVAKQLREVGMQKVTIYPTAGHPVVLGEWLGVSGAPTVLIYGHYDVQPADPLDLWKTPPFDPTVSGENLYGRGASDMKGQIVAVLEAVESVVKNGGLPVNIKWLLEGEEEIGSPNLESFITQKKDMLTADFCLNPDSSMIAINAPSITYALRGLAYFELRVYGPAHDLHSGVYGGVVRNPAIVLAKLIAGMLDAQGRVTLPDFYKRVRSLSPEERTELARLPYDEKFYLEQTGALALFGEEGYSPFERVAARPTLDVNGLLSGFTDEGSKTVIPAWAMAKISTRLVPDQDPQEVYQQLIQYLEKNAPKDIRWELTAINFAPASISDRENVCVQALSKAFEQTWGIQPYFKREGGSVPVVFQMQNILGIESVVTGFGLPDDNLHAPNEKIHLPTWAKGIEALVHFLWNF